jgi:GT2 family glycosyltransferase
VRFSVVVVNYRSWPLTLRCLDALRATGYDGGFETVVVDNDEAEEPGEPPGLPEGVRLIRPGKNLGFAGACNAGIRASTGEHLVLLNPDAVVTGDFFEGFEEFLRGEPRAGVVGPRVLDADGKLQLSARREVSLVSGLFGRTSLLTRLFPSSLLVKGQFPAVTAAGEPVAVDWVSGACMVLRRQMLDKVGLLDERFFMYFEDADLCRRAREAGWLVFYLPGVSIRHEAGGSSRNVPRAVWRLHKSAFLYHRKHGNHGPLNLYSLAILAGLAARALLKLVAR